MSESQSSRESMRTIPSSSDEMESMLASSSSSSRAIKRERTSRPPPPPPPLALPPFSSRQRTIREIVVDIPQELRDEAKRLNIRLTRGSQRIPKTIAELRLEIIAKKDKEADKKRQKDADVLLQDLVRKARSKPKKPTPAQEREKLLRDVIKRLVDKQKQINEPAESLKKLARKSGVALTFIDRRGRRVPKTERMLMDELRVIQKTQRSPAIPRFIKDLAARFGVPLTFVDFRGKRVPKIETQINAEIAEICVFVVLLPRQRRGAEEELHNSDDGQNSVRNAGQESGWLRKGGG